MALKGTRAGVTVLWNAIAPEHSIGQLVKIHFLPCRRFPQLKLGQGCKPNIRGRLAQISSLAPFKHALNLSKHLVQNASSVSLLVSRIDTAISTSLD